MWLPRQGTTNSPPPGEKHGGETQIGKEKHIIFNKHRRTPCINKRNINILIVKSPQGTTETLQTSLSIYFNVNEKVTT